MSYLVAGVILVGFGVSVGITVGSLWWLLTSILGGESGTRRAVDRS